MAARQYRSTVEAKTLSAGINSSVTSMTLNSVTTLPSTYPYTLVIDPDTATEEIVTVTASAGGTTLTIVRGQDGTSGQSHNSAAVVKHMITARDLQEPQDHIDAASNVHGLATAGPASASGGSVVGTTAQQTLTNKTLTAPTITSPTISGTITGTGVVSSTNILDGTIVNADINASAAISATKLTGTAAEFNGALSDDNFVTLTGAETLTNKTLTTPTINGDASFNTEIGTSALNALTTGTSNTALGYNALLLNTTGSSNTAIGSTALDANTTGGSNTSVGNSALGANTTGSSNTAVGRLSLVTNTTGSDNTAVGFNALRLNTASFNVAVGNEALYSNNIGQANTAIGYGALRTLAANSSCTAVGNGSLYSATGDENTAVGSYAGNNVTTGYFNTLIGGDAAVLLTTGNNNTVVGTQTASTLTTGSNNIVLGYNAALSSSTVSNQVVLGNSSITDLRCQDTTISAPSDIRDKTDVQEIPVGLDFINDIRPVNFEWNMRDGGQVGNRQGGFIAQEVLAVEQQYNTRNWLGMVNDDNPDQLVLAPAKLIPVLVKAIQELSARVAELESR